MYVGGIMRSNFMLLVGLSAIFVLLGIYGTSYVNGQTSANSSSAENETSSTNIANTALQTENFDPFKSRTSSNDVNDNNPSQSAADTTANSNNDGTSIANDDTATNDDTVTNDDTANSNNDDSSSNEKNDESDGDGSDDHKSSPDDIPFP